MKCLIDKKFKETCIFIRLFYIDCRPFVNGVEIYKSNKNLTVGTYFKYPGTCMTNNACRYDKIVNIKIRT